MARLGIYFTNGDEQYASTVSAEQAEAEASRLLLGAQLAEMRVVPGRVSLYFDNRTLVTGRATIVGIDILCEAIVGADTDAFEDDGARELLRRRALAINAMDRLGAFVESVSLRARGALAFQIGGTLFRMVLGPDDEACDIPAWDLAVDEADAVAPGTTRALVCSALDGDADYLAVVQP